LATLAEALAWAARSHQAGDLDQAEYLYRAILQAVPTNADAWHLLGVVASQRGRPDLGVDYIAKAIALNSACAAYHANLGVAYKALGQVDRALACYQHALRLQPDFVRAYNNLGAALHEQGRTDEAVACYQHALRLYPAEAEVHTNLGLALVTQGRLDEAVAHYQQALHVQPNLAEAHNNLGLVRKDQGRLDEAVAHFQQAVLLKPAYADAYHNLGSVRQTQGRLDEAIAHFEKAVHLKPNDAPGYNYLGMVLAAQGRLDEAMTHFQQALHLQPNLAEAYNSLGVVLYRQGRFEEADAHFQQAARLQPACAEAFNNRGSVLTAQGQLGEAVAHFQQVVRLRPTDAEAHKKYAMACLALGRFQEGWREYEWRWQCPGTSRPAFAQPLWDGSPLAGRTILLHVEQGLGDTLQFIRYAPLLKQGGGTVLVVSPPMLVPLLERCPGIDRLVPQGAALPPFDVQAPLLSLPGILGTTLETIPARVPYLFADPQRVAHWRAELGPGRAFAIGIAWQGNPQHLLDHDRSLPLTCLAPLAQLPGVRLVSVQHGPGTEQLAEVSNRFPVLDLGSRFEDFGDTAAALVNLDLVITVDTAVAHCAGGLGVPVWVVLPFVPDWRWLLEREDSPWYPSMRLFRQPERGNWPAVVARLAEAVEASMD
jgi:tetratricopeptide (TPR) repeat protein